MPELLDCKSCKNKYFKKHKAIKKFEISCTEGEDSNLKKRLKSPNLSEEERNTLKIMSDPVTWAYIHFDWKARWYQTQMLLCNAKRKVFRIGRRAGKCIANYSKLNTNLGMIEAEKVYNMENKPSILTFDETTQKIKTTNNYYIYENGIKPIYRLRTSTGRETHVTDNHPFFVNCNGKYEWEELKNIKKEDIIAILSEGILKWDKVKEIKYISDDMTYDLTVPETHTLISDNIISHNTETLVVKMLHYVYTNENKRILVIAPFRNQVELIFKRLKELLTLNKTLQSAITRSSNNPFVLKFSTGCEILGFTAGSSSGGKGNTIRGQRGDIVVEDEMDFLSKEDHESILAILSENSNIELWASSTPTGRHDKFYEWCNNEKFKEFHYSSKVNPGWTDEADEEMRKELSEIGYEHEIMANFADLAEGVFKNEYIDRSLKEYNYDISFKEYEYRTIGVDWNSQKYGCQILLLGFNVNKNKYRVLRRCEVSHTEFTQSLAVKKIMDWNDIYEPQYIYVDKGFGGYQVETLHAKGLSNKESGLIHKVKAIDFGGNLEVRDHGTKQKIKKKAKPFMINCVVRSFETDMIDISMYDDDFIKQLRAYVVAKISKYGEPTYDAGGAGDHILDAFSLAHLAMILEFSHIRKVTYARRVGITKGFGVKGDVDVAKYSEIKEKQRPTNRVHNTDKRIRSRIPKKRERLLASSTIFWDEHKGDKKKGTFGNKIYKQKMPTRSTF